MDKQPAVRFVPHLPDLIEPQEYEQDGTAPGERLVRVRIRVTEDGVTILADAQAPLEVEALLARLGVREIEQMLCG